MKKGEIYGKLLLDLALLALLSLMYRKHVVSWAVWHCADFS